MLSHRLLRCRRLVLSQLDRLFVGLLLSIGLLGRLLGRLLLVRLLRLQRGQRVARGGRGVLVQLHPRQVQALRLE